ncbi:MAG: LPS assembly lipoprotein LptE [Burkholderiaceae bacterium]|nr:LPS assembly lipoprotein LptE [Burkholderiaceae bacterium]MDH3461119.1 LPS assembly lipoprotein LptE [Burkholderiaceae bacterium]
MNRRALLGALHASLLAGCGYSLRRAPELRFRTVQLVGFKPSSPLADELRRHIEASSNTRVVDADAPPQVIFEVLAEARHKGVVASTAAGLVRELQLRARLSFWLRTPAGKELIAPTEIALSRDMSYDEGAALGKEYEEALIYRAMQSEIVSQVMRRLAAVQKI